MTGRWRNGPRCAKRGIRKRARGDQRRARRHTVGPRERDTCPGFERGTFRLGAGNRQLRAYVVRRDGDEHAESGRVACAEEKLSYHVS